MRQVIWDTETTGIDPKAGHRLIEIGCVEMEGRRLTGRTYHQYINPERGIEQEAIDIHGITNEFLVDKPVFSKVAAEFAAFVDGAEIIAHNAAFDVGFLNNEFLLDGNRFGPLGEMCKITDTLAIARKKHPGQRNSLDALCKRYGIDNSHRTLHGALLDAEILADVYLLLTGGQVNLALTSQGEEGGGSVDVRRITDRAQGVVLHANDIEILAHNEKLQAISQASDGQCVWLID